MSDDNAANEVIKPPKLVRLTLEEERSPAWQKVKQFIQQELDASIVALCTDLDPIKTARVRGRISVLNLVAALEETPAPSTVDEVDED